MPFYFFVWPGQIWLKFLTRTSLERSIIEGSLSVEHSHAKRFKPRLTGKNSSRGIFCDHEKVKNVPTELLGAIITELCNFHSRSRDRLPNSVFFGPLFATFSPKLSNGHPAKQKRILTPQLSSNESVNNSTFTHHIPEWHTRASVPKPKRDRFAPYQASICQKYHFRIVVVLHTVLGTQ